MFKKSKPAVVNGEETAGGASPPPTTVFRWLVLVLLSPRALRELCVGRAIPGQGLSYTSGCVSPGVFPLKSKTLVVLKSVALSSRLVDEALGE